MATSSKRPGIKSKRTKPQRDALGRFAPKVTAEWDGTAWVTRAQKFEEQFQAEEPGWLKGFAQAVGLRVIRFGFWISARGLDLHYWAR